MKGRTFGWVQNPSSTETLIDVLSIFVPGSKFHTYMVNERLPLLSSANLYKEPNLYMEFQKLLRSKKAIAYDKLKGQGAGTSSRKNAKCSGLIQAAITGQQNKEYTIDGKKIIIKKPYVDDWSADGYLRWAISLGLLDYNYEEDTCRITKDGIALVRAKTKKKKETLLGKAFLSYPPVCRVMQLLEKHGHMTKFEIGSKLGFTDEAGFTSFPQNIWVQAYEEATDQAEKKKMRSNTEGSSDKYARMICGWLESLQWVTKTTKKVQETIGGKTYNCDITSAFEITETGILKYNAAVGKTKGTRISKIVYREMLASKASNANYLRNRRSLIISYLSNHAQRTIKDIQNYLLNNGINENTTTLRDDLNGLINIGLDIDIINDTKYKLNDEIVKLVPYSGNIAKEITDAVEIKDKVRQKLQNIDHKYLTLIDYAFSGKDKCAEFEIYTIDLLVNELKFEGIHLGGTRKPDGIFYYQNKGVIIDNKAYSKGFTITRSMADEMTRYVQENNDRNSKRNPNQWWKNFNESVSIFHYVFISSLFKGELTQMLNNIKQSTGVDGCALTAENLLYFADAIKGGSIKRTDFIDKFGINKELVFTHDKI